MVSLTPVFVSLAAHLTLAFGLRAPCALSPPSTANTIAPDYVSISLELDGFLSWVGQDSRNEFFYNALDNIIQLAGVPPRIRVGGKSLDLTYWSQPTDTIVTAYPPATEADPYPDVLRATVGEGFYRRALFLPNNTKVIHALNFMSSDDWRGLYHLNTILNSYLSYDFKDANIRLDAIEIGQEPDLYTNRYPPPYTPQKYVNEWTNWAGNVLNYIPSFQPDISHYGLKLWSGSLSATSSSSTGFSPKTLFQEGLLTRTSAGPAISSFSQHHYSGGTSCARNVSLAGLVNKASVRKSLAAFSSDIAATRAKGIEYVLGEVGTFACHGVPGTSNTAGSVMWALDYLLQASILGVSRVFFHQGIGHHSNILQPSPLPRSPLDGKQLPTPLSPYIQPQYYAAIIAAEAIGSSGNTRVAELSLDDPAVSGYAFYEANVLKRAIFINSAIHLSKVAESKPRPSVRIVLELPRNVMRRASLKRLDIASADDTSNLRWGGVTYDTEDARPLGSQRQEAVDLAAGFNLQATEVVLVSFE